MSDLELGENTALIYLPAAGSLPIRGLPIVDEFECCPTKELLWVLTRVFQDRIWAYIITGWGKDVPEQSQPVKGLFWLEFLPKTSDDLVHTAGIEEQLTEYRSNSIKSIGQATCEYLVCPLASSMHPLALEYREQTDLTQPMIGLIFLDKFQDSAFPAIQTQKRPCYCSWRYFRLQGHEEPNQSLGIHWNA